MQEAMQAASTSPEPPAHPRRRWKRAVVYLGIGYVLGLASLAAGVPVVSMLLERFVPAGKPGSPLPEIDDWPTAAYLCAYLMHEGTDARGLYFQGLVTSLDNRRRHAPPLTKQQVTSVLGPPVGQMQRDEASMLIYPYVSAQGTKMSAVVEVRSGTVAGYFFSDNGDAYRAWKEKQADPGNGALQDEGSRGPTQSQQDSGRSPGRFRWVGSGDTQLNSLSRGSGGVIGGSDHGHPSG